MAGTNKIYVITRCSGRYEDYIEYNIGYVETEEEAKTKCAELTAQIATNPYDSYREEQVERAYMDWGCVEEEWWDEQHQNCPYYDESKIPAIQNVNAYYAWQDEKIKECVTLRIEWFNYHHPGLTTPEEFQQWLEWRTDYADTHYKYKPVERL